MKRWLIERPACWQEATQAVGPPQWGKRACVALGSTCAVALIGYWLVGNQSPPIGQPVPIRWVSNTQKKAFRGPCAGPHY